LVKITFLGGINEIGGNCFLVEDKETKLLLDFGKRYSVYGRFFEEYLKPRSASGIVDLLTLGLIPNRLEFYRADLLAMIGKTAPTQRFLDGILLSHIHYDHSANISFLDERVPVYSSRITQFYAKALIESGRRNIETELYNFKPRPLLDYGTPATTRPFETFDPGDELKIGSITVHSYPVDHSVAGAAAYLLECSDLSLAYTGDLRLHGPLGAQTMKCVEKMADRQPDLLLCEGTRIDDNTANTEEDVKENALEVAQRCKKLIIADFAPRDVFRLATFHQIAKEIDRKLLIMKQDAYLIRELRKAPSLQSVLPSIDDNSILVYIDRKDSGTYRSKDYEKWEQEFVGLPNAVKSDYVHQNQAEVIACLGFFDINELIDVRPAKGSIYIESISEPHDEEQQIDLQRLNNWLDFFGLEKSHFHSSGHACATDLKSIAQKAGPRHLIPIHTKQPTLFRQIHDDVTIVQPGQTVSFTD